MIAEFFDFPFTRADGFVFFSLFAFFGLCVATFMSVLSNHRRRLERLERRGPQSQPGSHHSPDSTPTAPTGETHP